MPSFEHRSWSAPGAGAQAGFTVRKGYSITWKDETFRPGDRIPRDHPCVSDPVSRSRPVVLPGRPTPPLVQEPEETEENEEE